METNEQTRQLYEKASKSLFSINEAWQNPDIEDLAFTFCQSIKECMHNFLSCFLLMRTGEVNSQDTLGSLVHQCAAIDDRFGQIDLRWISCKDTNLDADGDMFCTPAPQVKICIWIANGIKKLIDEDLQKAGGEVLMPAGEE